MKSVWFTRSYQQALDIVAWAGPGFSIDVKPPSEAYEAAGTLYAVKGPRWLNPKTIEEAIR